MVSINRVVMGPASRRMIQELKPPRLKVAEVSGHYGQQFDFKSYEQFRYPEYDICAGPYLDPETGKLRKFDLILANQVWEHLDRPYTATKYVRQMLKKGGILGRGAVLCAVPCGTHGQFTLVRTGAQEFSDRMRV